MASLWDTIMGSKEDEIPKDRASLQKKIAEVAKKLDAANAYDLDSGQRYPSQTSVSKEISSDTARVQADKKYLLNFKSKLEDQLAKTK